MDSSLPNSALGRVAGVSMILAALFAVALRLLSGEAAVLDPVVTASVLFGAMACSAPWDRWPRPALLSIVAVVLVLKPAAAFYSGLDAHSHGIYYAVLAMWTGVAFGRGVPLACALPMGASYLAPMWVAEAPGVGPAAALGVVPSCVITGEVAAWFSGRLRSAERESAERAGKMGALVDTTLAMTSCQEPDPLARLVAFGMADVYAADATLVFLETPDGLRLAARQGTGGAGGDDDPAADPELALLLWRALQQPDSEPDEQEAAQLRQRLGFAELHVNALRGSASAGGLVLAGSTEARSHCDPVTDYIAQTLATQAGLALDRIHAARELRDESLRDALTGLGNRRAAMAALESLEPGDALALIDLDHFKRVNDSFGHAAGDRVLRTLGTFLRDSLRSPDGVYRIGGEEFLAVLSQADGTGIQVMRRLLERWRRLERVTTFSAGVAVHHPGEAAERTLGRADAALYEAKGAGRNCVVQDASEGDAPQKSADPTPDRPVRLRR